MADLETFGKRLNFGCGFVAGAVSGVFGVSDWFTGSFFGSVIIVLALALLCAMLAARYGDAFWYDFFRSI